MLAKRFSAVSGFLFLVGVFTTANGQETAHPYYNIKAGPVYVTLSAQTSTEFLDNVNLSSGILTPIQSDLIFTPSFGINAVSQMQFHPASEINTNTLGLSMNIGYREHILRPQLNQKIFDLNISPDSELSFLIRIGHFKIRLHNGFALQSDPVTDGALSNIAVFQRFTDTAGANVEWDVNSDTLVNLAYTHSLLHTLNLISLGNAGANSLNSGNLNNATDALSLMASTKIIPEITIGAGGSVSATNFPSAPEQNSTTYSYGPFATARLTDYTSLNASCGITQNQRGNVFLGGNNNTNFTASDSTSQYFNVSLTNHLNTYYSQTLSVGRQSALDLVGTQTATNYLRYSSVWKVNAHIALNFDGAAEDVTDLSTSKTGITNFQSNFRRYTGGFSTSYIFSKKLSTSLSYRYIQKDTSDRLQCYKQNDVVWSVAYHF